MARREPSSPPAWKAPPRAVDDVQVPVHAHFVAKRINVARLLAERFPEQAPAERPSTGQRATVTVIQLSGSQLGGRVRESADTRDGLIRGPFGPLFRYVCVFPFGSVVFFNCPADVRGRVLDDVRRYSDGAYDTPITDDFLLRVATGQQELFAFGHDAVSLRDFDVNSVRVISQVLGQTVAMDANERAVETMLQQFHELNTNMESSGRLTMDKSHLFRLVSANNAVVTEIVSKLKLLDRSDTVWRYGKYSLLWEGMRDDFEFNERFHALEFKLTHVQEQTKFFLEVLHNQKSDKLEWIIIILITFEILLGLYEMYATMKRTGAIGGTPEVLPVAPAAQK